MIPEEKLGSFLRGTVSLLEDIAFSLKVLMTLCIPPSTPDFHGLVGEQKAVYELCDATLSVQEIAKKIGRPGNQVRKTLTRLKEKGLVAQVPRGNRRYYFRVFPTWRGARTGLQNIDGDLTDTVREEQAD